MKISRNLHRNDFRADTIEFDVRINWSDPDAPDIDELAWAALVSERAEFCFAEIKYGGGRERQWCDSYSFAGRSGGWFAILTSYDAVAVPDRCVNRAERIIKKHMALFKNDIEVFIQKEKQHNDNN